MAMTCCVPADSSLRQCSVWDLAMGSLSGAAEGLEKWCDKPSPKDLSITNVKEHSYIKIVIHGAPKSI